MRDVSVPEILIDARLLTGPLTNLTDGGEGTVGLSEETRQRIDFNLHSAEAPGERGVANRFYFELCSGVRSVPVRPLGKTAKPRALAEPAEVSREPSVRQAAALAASAIANRVLLEPGALLPRRLTVDGAQLIMEFGVCKNILEAGLATFAGGEPTYEQLELTQRGYARLTTSWTAKGMRARAPARATILRAFDGERSGCRA
jgi:hypothetical protein